MNIMDDILWAFERKKCVAMACIDLSAAFDTVDRNILRELLKLKVWYHRQGIASA